MSYRLFKLKKPQLFKAKFSRGKQSLNFSTNPNNSKSLGVKGNSQSTSSFRYSSDKNLKSTQQLNIDYSYFENHTFFDSALSKTNIAFDKIINEYPFDGSLKQVEAFEDELTGYENYVLNNFPKYTGSIHLSGTRVDEDPANGYAAGLGQFITVKDGKGLEYPVFSREKKATPVLDPKDSSFSVEMFLAVPPEANAEQIIFQKR